MHKTYALFPTPLQHVSKFISDAERKKIIALSKEEYQNVESSGLNHSTDISYYLDRIKERAERLCVPLGVDLFGQELEWKLTSMWRNVLEKDGYQYIHNHCNSFISGIIYVNLPEGSPKTKFFRPQNTTDFIFSNYNQESSITNFNSEWVDIPEVGQLDMVVFPSYIKHAVDRMEVDGKRITLSFNAVPKKLCNGPYTIEFKV